MEKEGHRPAYDGDLKVEITDHPQYLSVLKSSLKVGALIVPKTKSFPLLSRIQVTLEPPNNVGVVSLLAEVVYDTGSELGLQIIELKEEDRKKLEDLFDHPIQPKTKPPPRPISSASHPLHVPKEGLLSLHFPADMQRLHHEGENFLGEDSIFTLIDHLEKDQFTGKLTLETDDHATTLLYFVQGHLVSADKNPLEETTSLAYLLKKEKQLSDADYREIRRLQTETKKSEGDLLKEKVSESAIRSTSVTFINQILDHAVASRKLHYTLVEGSAHIQGIIQVGINLKKAIFRAMIEAAASYKTEELWAGLEGHMNHYVIEVPEQPIPIKELKLKTDELRFWEVTLAKPTRLRNLFAVSAMSKVKSLRFIYALYFLGMIDFTTQIQVKDFETIPHLKQVLAEMEVMNPFEILQVHWTALRQAILTAYERSEKEWNQFDVPASMKGDAAPLLQAIHRKLKSAVDFLSIDSNRQELRNKTIEPHMQGFTAELFGEHTKSYLYRGDMKQARLYAEMAVDLCPKSLEYRNLLASCGKK